MDIYREYSVRTCKSFQHIPLWLQIYTTRTHERKWFLFAVDTLLVVSLQPVHMISLKTRRSLRGGRGLLHRLKVALEGKGTRLDTGFFVQVRVLLATRCRRRRRATHVPDNNV